MNHLPRPLAVCRRDEEFSAAEIAAAARTRRLLTLELELSRACNLRCLYCYASAGQAASGELAPEEIRAAVAQAQELGARKIVILGGGEPLCCPALRETIEFLVARGLTVELFTNGTLLDQATAEFLHRHDVQVVVKLNSRRAAVQDELAGAPGALQAIERGLAALGAAGYPDPEHALGVETVVCRQNLAEIPALWRWARQKGIEPYVETLTVQGRARAHPELLVEKRETEALFAELARIDHAEFARDWQPYPPLAGSSCRRHLYSCTVTATGEVLPCPGLDLPLGNLRRTTLAEILATHPVVRQLRNIYDEIRGPCRTCEFHGTCYGCRGNAWQLTGDYLQSDPTCWRVNGT
jgi:radical SAM protein with 4Fe4S-binding SPASM domain